MASDQEAAYERVLSANLNRVVDWVKYRDAKNAALLAFASAWLAGIGNLLLAAEEKHTPALIAFLLFVSELLFLIGALHAIVALLPATNTCARCCASKSMTSTARCCFDFALGLPSLPAAIGC